MKFIEVKDIRKNGEDYTKGLRITFGINKLTKAGFTKDDNLKVEYHKNKIIITKEEN